MWKYKIVDTLKRSLPIKVISITDETHVLRQCFERHVLVPIRCCSFGFRSSTIDVRKNNIKSRFPGAFVTFDKIMESNLTVTREIHFLLFMTSK